MQCQRTGCEAAATHAPVLVIPPQGGSHTQLGRLRAIIGLRLCRACADSAQPADLLTEEGKRRVRVQCLAHGARQPDFERAIVEAIPMSGGEFQAFLRVSGGAP